MTKVRIIGVGSPVGDGALGWVFVDRFRQQARYDQSMVEVVKCLSPATELFSLLQGTELLILVDAVASDQAGKIYLLDQDELHLRQDFISSHGMDVVTALDLAGSLHLLPDRLWIYGIGVLESVEGEGSLSGEVDQAVSLLVAQIEALLDKLFAEEVGSL